MEFKEEDIKKILTNKYFIIGFFCFILGILLAKVILYIFLFIAIILMIIFLKNRNKKQKNI